ncbi:MAG: hypothetical protein AAFV19_20665 [Pseudomonadota bacterium]
MTRDHTPITDDDLLSFAQGKAGPDVSAAIEEAQRDDPVLAAEIAMMQGLKPALAELSGGANPPGEFGWRRLEGEIDREIRAPVAPQERSGGNIIMWKAAAVFFGLAVLGQTTYHAMTPAPEVTYQAASQVAAEYVGAVRFAPTATEAEIRAVLQAIGARLVDGPGATGIYRVAFNSQEELTAGKAALSESGVIDAVMWE